MSDRGHHLFDAADKQITELEVLLSTTDEAALRYPCPGRENLGDRTVAAVAPPRRRPRRARPSTCLGCDGLPRASAPSSF